MRFSAMLIAPAAVAAMQSAGAPSGTPVVGVSTLYSTQTVTITSCLPSVTDCPARSSTIVVPIGTTTTTAFVTPSASSSSSTTSPAATIVVPSTSVPATSVPATSSTTSSATLIVPSSSASVCVPSTVKSYVTLCPSSTSVPATLVPATSVPASSVPASSVPATSVPATSVPATSVPATSVPATNVPASSKGAASATNVYVPKNTTVPFMQANAGSSLQVGSVAIVALAGVVAFFL